MRQCNHGSTSHQVDILADAERDEVVVGVNWGAAGLYAISGFDGTIYRMSDQLAVVAEATAEKCTRRDGLLMRRQTTDEGERGAKEAYYTLSQMSRLSPVQLAQYEAQDWSSPTEDMAEFLSSVSCVCMSDEESRDRVLALLQLAALKMHTAHAQ